MQITLASALFLACTSTTVLATQYPLTGGNAAIPAGTNPYYQVGWYVDEDYTRKVNASIAVLNKVGTAAASTTASLANLAGNTPTFIWVQNFTMVDTKLEPSLTDSRNMNKLRTDGRPGPITTMFHIYNLPDRDCASGAAAGEIVNGNDSNSYDQARQRYRAFIDKVAAKFQQYTDIRIVAVVEPDALVNMALSTDPRCLKAKANYFDGIYYAVAKLQFPHVALYLDAGSGSLVNTAAKQTTVVNQIWSILNATTHPNPSDWVGAGGSIRGIFTNKASLNPLQMNTAPATTTTTVTNAGSIASSPAFDAISYAESMSYLLGNKTLNAGKMPSAVLVDTSRNGVYPIAGVTSEWCNVKGSGFGPRPTDQTFNRVIDAFVWSQGGISDGTSNPNSTRYDPVCAKPVAMRPANTTQSPEQGLWFHDFFVNLVNNAKPQLNQN